MKSIYCFVLLFLLGLICSSYSPAQQRRKLILMTYNIHHGAPENSDSVNLETIAEVIRRSNAEIVALQEVDVHTARSGNINEAAILGKKLGMYHYFSKSIDYDGGAYGVAILSKFPISSPQRHDLPMLQKGEKRSVALANINLPNGQTIKFGTTHFDLNTPNRTAQAQFLSLLNKSIDIPLFIGGDYNAESGSKEIAVLEKSFKLSCINKRTLSIPVHNPDRAIDYFAFNSHADNLFKLITTEAMMGEYASDHLPVIATFDY